MDHNSTPAPGSPHSSRLSPEVAEALAALGRATEVLCGMDVAALEGRAAMTVAAEVAVVVSRLAAVKVRVLPVVEADGLWATGGARSFARWVADEHHVAVRTAREQVRLGRALRDHLPATAVAALTGEITVEHAQVVAALAPTTVQRRAVLADEAHECNEGFLVDQARSLPVDDLRTLVRQWAAAADPDADDRGYVQSCDREFMQVDRLGDMYHLTGQLTVPHGQALRAALEAVTPVPAAGDERTTAQRRGQALADLAQVILDHGLAGTGRSVRPQVTVLVSEPRFRALVDAALARESARDAARVATGDGTRGAGDATPDDSQNAGRTTVTADPAANGSGDGNAAGRTPPYATPAVLTGTGADLVPQYADGTPIPRPVLDKVACDGGLNRVIFSAQSQVLDVGRTERLFTGPRRTAIIARDKHCRYPGCTAPPVLSECHHIDHWARDHGPTSVTNGILLCFHHHDLVHRRTITIHRDHSRFVFLDTHGTPINPDHDRTPRR